ncbi:hypothetical protein PAXRUDRAFT_822187 [Paxillus rubicundulus Ve08.2h10]|uniref:Uncharacterized protein n=1 Tax=Paxillus rubicundulus Ve08.2h10 TaxID=930991 RepID=A0A0D0ECT2_9AGAM|nr:hypothetical protein PAXRUDRAFT_822187 [Paxillus rubicundulus Ve08.2h10]
MSPLSYFKRDSVSSTKSSRSSTSSNSPVLVYGGHPSPLDITYAVNIQPWSPRAPGSSDEGGYAKMLDDDNMSWGSGKPSKSKRFKRRSFGLF